MRRTVYRCQCQSGDGDFADKYDRITRDEGSPFTAFWSYLLVLLSSLSSKQVYSDDHLSLPSRHLLHLFPSAVSAIL